MTESIGNIVRLKQWMVERRGGGALDMLQAMNTGHDLRDGFRKVMGITEVQGMEVETITMQNVLQFRDEGERDGKVIGEMEPCGIRPRFEPRLNGTTTATVAPR